MNKKPTTLPLIWYSSDYSHPGHRRRENEDAIYSDARSGTWCVADGMGGHRYGQLASRLLVENVAAMDNRGSLAQRVEAAEKRIFLLNRLLFDKGRQSFSEEMNKKSRAPGGASRNDPAYFTDASGRAPTIGCTFIVLLSDGFNCTCMWAGDSRLYLQREGNLYQITEDHTVVNDLLTKGVITQEQSESHPQRHIVTRALGASASILLEKKTFVAAGGDGYLLCSDGLHNEIAARDISAAMAVGESSESCRRLMDQVLQGDAPDNLSACVIKAHSRTAA